MLPVSKDYPLLSKEYHFFSGAETSTKESSHAILSVNWRVHLLKRDPARLPILLLVMAMGAACVWLMFGTLLPVLASGLLLMGSVSEYLFPITYRLSDGEVCQESLTSRIQLPWKDARRCRMGQDALLLTSLAVPSRLDAFRGVLLRFAPEGQPGDKSSVCAMITRYAPHVLQENTLPMAEQEPANSITTTIAVPEISRVENSQT